MVPCSECCRALIKKILRWKRELCVRVRGGGDIQYLLILVLNFTRYLSEILQLILGHIVQNTNYHIYIISVFYVLKGAWRYKLVRKEEGSTPLWDEQELFIYTDGKRNATSKYCNIFKMFRLILTFWYIP